MTGTYTRYPTVGGGNGDVTGPASSVDSQVALFSGTTGKILKAAAGTGLAYLTSGVLSTVALGTAYQFYGVNSGASAVTALTLAGTTNQVNVGTAGTTVTLSLPQSINTGASPTFAGLTLTSFSGVVKAATGVLSASTIVNADVSGTAAIAYSKLSLTGSIVNGDISASAAIAYSKLALTGSILNADLAGSIAYSKLTLTNSIVNADVATTAAIGYSKLALTGSILNADLAGSIAYSKLTLTGSIVNADISASAAIAYSKLSLASSIATGDLAAGLLVPVGKGGTGTTTATGTGSVVLSSSPTLVTPTLGAATATSINFGGSTLATYTEQTVVATFNTGAFTAGSAQAVNAVIRKIGKAVILELQGVTATTNATSASMSTSGTPLSAYAPAGDLTFTLNTLIAGGANTVGYLAVAATGALTVYFNTNATTTVASGSTSVGFARSGYSWTTTA